MVDCFQFRATHHFSELVYNYVEQSEEFKDFITDFPNAEAFKHQISLKSANYHSQNRLLVAEALEADYARVEGSEKVKNHLNLLRQNNTFTVTTGHQLNLFTGPLYFFYKIIATINLCEELSLLNPDYNFVPIYWMASEDHDFEEINFFNFKREKITWESSQKGPVGEFLTKDITVRLEQLQTAFGDHDYAQDLIQLFQEAYTAHETLAEAHFYLVNKLFGHYGLLVLDANKKSLKSAFKTYIKNELLQQVSYQSVQEQSKRLKSVGYNIQVNPRDINLFYIDRGVRERIVKESNRYQVLETKIDFSESEILQLLEDHPEKFSPNVITRPLYQEVLLPNLCYIGGGGELAYWLQLKSFFDQQSVVFPLLLLRSSVLLYSDKSAKKLKQLDLEVKDLFLDPLALEEKLVKRESTVDINFSKQVKFLKQQFSDLYQVALRTDASFEGAVAAQEQKQINGLMHLEKRLLKAQKRQLKEYTKRALALQEMLFPEAGLQERHLNFSEVYVDNGHQFISILKENLQPLSGMFYAIELEIYGLK